MSIIGWIVLGLIWGVVASRGKTGISAALDVELSIVGAVLAGDVYTTFGIPEAGGLYASSMLAAVAGAMAVPLLYHSYKRREMWAWLTRRALTPDKRDLRQSL